MCTIVYFQYVHLLRNIAAAILDFQNHSLKIWYSSLTILLSNLFIVHTVI